MLYFKWQNNRQNQACTETKRQFPLKGKSKATGLKKTKICRATESRIKNTAFLLYIHFNNFYKVFKNSEKGGEYNEVKR